MRQSFRKAFIAVIAIASAALSAYGRTTVCGNDSAVVIYTSDCQGQPDECTYSVVTDHYNLSTGSLNGTSFWSKTDTLFNGSGSISELLTTQGSSNGWQNSRSVIFNYSLSGQLTDRYERIWNGTAWDTTGWTHYSFDSAEQLIQRAEYAVVNGTWTNTEKHDYGYSAGQLLWHERYQGDGMLWVPEIRFEYTYNGTVRTFLEAERWEDVAGAWVRIERAPYETINSRWCARIHTVVPGSYNGISTSEVYDDYDLEDRVIHHYEFITSFAGPEPLAESSESFYTVVNGETVPEQTICIDQYQWWDGTWQPLVNCCTNTYSYSAAGLLLQHLIECGEGGRGSTVFTYDAYGRLLTETFHANNHSEQITRDYHVEYIYPSSDRIRIFIAPQTVSPVPCRGATVQPLVGVSGGCDGKSYRWEPSRGLSSDTLLSPDILIEDSVTYTLTVTDASGNQATSTLIIGPMDVRPEIENISACPDQIVLHATATGQTGDFTWFRSGSPEGNGEFLHVTQPGTYHVTNGRWQQPPNYASRENCLSASLPVTISTSPAPFQSEQFVEICAGDEYVLPDGTAPAQSGEYRTQLENLAGCDSFITVHLTILPEVAPMVLSSGNVLFTPTQGEYYVWYLYGEPLTDGEETTSISVTEEGLYSVLVIDSNGCEGVSAPYYLSISDVDPTLDEIPFVLYPNPVGNILHVLFHFEPDEPTRFSLYDVSGQCVREQILTGISNRIDVGDLSSGSYMAVLKNGDEVIRRTVSIAH
jgi:hypothetical protein